MPSKPELSLLERGNFSDVFAIDDARVLKAFVRVPADAWSAEEEAAHAMLSFEAERQFYEQLSTWPDWAVHFPDFLGVANPTDWILPGSRDVVSGCGLILERIPGKPKKFNQVSAEIEARISDLIDAIAEEFTLQNPWDGSCFVPGTRADFTLIDVAGLV